MANRASYTIQDFYASYAKEYPAGHMYHVDYKTFRKITSGYFSWITDSIIDRASEVKLPSNMGKVLVVKRKPFGHKRQNYNVDFIETRRLGKTILHLNEHSDGYSYRFIWDKSSMNTHNKYYYEMIHTRAAKRRLAKSIKEKKIDYIEQER